MILVRRKYGSSAMVSMKAAAAELRVAMHTWAAETACSAQHALASPLAAWEQHICALAVAPSG